MASRPPRVVAIGDGIVDLVTPPMEDFAPGDVQAEVPRFDPLPGGNATNFALQMSSLGASTTFIGAVGSDSNAKLLRDRYREYGVRARLFVDPSRPTGSTMALTWSTGRRALVTNPGANARLRLSDVPLRAIRGAHHVHRSGFWWTSGLVGKPTATLLARARRLGATTSLDVSTDPQGWPADRIQAVRICLPHVDLFFGNETEICAVAGEKSPIRAGKRLRSLGAAEVVIHQGERGATVITPSGVVRGPAFDVAIDNPTGCGDVFNAAYVYSKLARPSVRESLRFANAAAALHLRNRRRPYPTLAEVRRFLRRFAPP